MFCATSCCYACCRRGRGGGGSDRDNIYSDGKRNETRYETQNEIINIVYNLILDKNDYRHLEKMHGLGFCDYSEMQDQAIVGQGYRILSK